MLSLPSTWFAEPKDAPAPSDIFLAAFGLARAGSKEGPVRKLSPNWTQHLRRMVSPARRAGQMEPRDKNSWREERLSHT